MASHTAESFVAVAWWREGLLRPFSWNRHRLDRIGGIKDVDGVKPAVKKPTTGTKFAAEARKQCNKLSDESRMQLTAAAMRLIYHSRAGAEKAVAHSR